MGLTSLSSIDGWLNLDLRNFDQVRPCQFVDYASGFSTPHVVNTSCAKVCNDSESLFRPGTSNLLTCGTWATIASVFTDVSSTDSHTVNETFSVGLFDGFRAVNGSVTSIFDDFQAVGLDSSVLPYTRSYTDTISECFLETYLGVNAWSVSNDDAIIPAFCRVDSMFPFSAMLKRGGGLRDFSNQTLDSSINSALGALRPCVAALCSPRTLNPDIAGIGVSLPLSS